jgi:hypothetical protein
LLSRHGVKKYTRFLVLLFLTLLVRFLFYDCPILWVVSF